MESVMTIRYVASDPNSDAKVYGEGASKEEAIEECAKGMLRYLQEHPEHEDKMSWKISAVN